MAADSSMHQFPPFFGCLKRFRRAKSDAKMRIRAKSDAKMHFRRRFGTMKW
jgi:hypothetical protein